MGRTATHTVCTVDDCTKAHRARGLCSTHYNQRAGNRPTADVKARRKVPHTCERCGSTFRADPCHAQRFCSVSCASSGRQSKWGRRAHALSKLRRAATGTSGKSAWQQGCCARCGGAFVSLACRGSLFCSADCKRREKAHERRARTKGAFVARVSRAAIFARDNWTCQLCGLPANPTATVPDPLSPTIDHVIPLANGGTHGPDNVQLAHFICNSTKSNRC